MEYEKIINALYIYTISDLGVKMCGPYSAKALQKVSAILERQTDLDFKSCADIEGFITDGFAENAENGFYQGFQCAAALFLGKQQNITAAFKRP